MNYRCVEIPEPDFDASFTDEMVVTAYQDEDDLNPQIPDEYPNVRLTQLETDIQQTSLTAAEAIESASDASILATQANEAASQAEQLANDIAQELASLGTKVFSCASFNKVQGGTVTGDVTSIATPNDGNTLRVNEAAAGLTVDFNFTAVDSFNVIAMHLRYAGGANHTWQIQLYNFITSQFQTIGENIGTTSDIVWFNLPVVADEQFINNGNVVLRFNHVSPFISTHYALFDYVALSSNLAIVNPPIQKENVIGLKTTDSPEFADTQITGLKSVENEGEVSNSIYIWFKSLFPSLVDGSVKSWIVGLVTFVKTLADRISALENDIINYSISVPEDVSAVNIAGLNAPKGSTIILVIDFVYSVNTPASTYNMLFNDITTGYRNAGLSNSSNAVLYSPSSEGSQYLGTIMVADTITVLGSNLRKAVGGLPGQLIVTSSLPNFADSALTKITIRTTESGKIIAAGTKINIKVIV